MAGYMSGCAGEDVYKRQVNVPYGYVKDPENPKHWLVDPEAAAIVKRIFSMCMEGRGPTQIANQLWVDKVLTPTAYKLSHGLSTNSPAPEDPYRWDKRAVSSIPVSYTHLDVYKRQSLYFLNDSSTKGEVSGSIWNFRSESSV